MSLPDNDGNTPLHHAALSGHPEVVQMLSETMVGYCMSPDYRNSMGYTAILLACKYGHYVSAHVLLTVAKASPTIRDNEFFLDAKEWVERSSCCVRNSLSDSAQEKTAVSEVRESFTREKTMYGPSLPHQCHHWTPARHPLGRSLDSALKLPPIFQRQSVVEDEIFLEGRVASRVLLTEIDDVLLERESRPSTRVSIRSRKSHPRTAKLRALSTGTPPGRIPDMKYIFQLYSDQYSDFKAVRRSKCDVPPVVKVTDSTELEV